LNVALRKALGTYANIRRGSSITGMPSALRDGADLDILLLRELHEDTYGGFDYPAGSPEVESILSALGIQQYDPLTTGLGLKISTQQAARDMIYEALDQAYRGDRKKITIVHKGNIMKYTEGAFLGWCMASLKTHPDVSYFDDQKVVYLGKTIEVDNVLTDAFFNQLIRHPERCDIVVTMNLNGDYISDAIAGLCGGLGVMPGVNKGKDVKIYEPAHGTSPSLAGRDRANPIALLLSIAWLLDDKGLSHASDAMRLAITTQIAHKILTQDLCIHAYAGIKPVSLSHWCERLLDLLA